MDVEATAIIRLGRAVMTMLRIYGIRAMTVEEALHQVRQYLSILMA